MPDIAPAAPAAPSSTPSTPSSPAPAPAAKGGSLPPPDSRLAKDGTPSTSAPETPAEKKTRKLTLKVDGKEEVYDLDSAKDEDLVRDLQLSRAASARMSEAAKIRKQFTDFVDLAKRDPKAALSDPLFGLDLDKWSEQRLLERYKESQLSPEQLEAQKLKREIEAAKGETQKLKDAQSKREQEELDTKTGAEMEAQFKAALEKHKLPRNARTVELMAQIGWLNNQHGIDLSPEQMASEVKKYMKDTHDHFVGDMDEASLVEFLGEKNVKRLLKYSVAKVRGAPKASPKQEPAQGEEPEKRQMLSPKQWRKLI